MSACSRRIAHHRSILSLMLVFAGCGSSPPARAPTTGGGADESAPAAEEVAAAPEAAANAEAPPNEAAEPTRLGSADESNEFKKVDTHTAKDTKGVKESKLKATETEALLKFVVLDKEKGPVEGVVVSLVGPDGKKYYAKETDAVGYAEALVPVGQNYDIVYLSLGKKEIAAKTPVDDQSNLTIKLTLTYKRFVPRPSEKSTREYFILDGVEFDTGKATIRPGSFARLDNIVEYMQHKPKSRVEISGHTDNVGKKPDNQLLSQRRAQACRDYLIKQGIDASRIEAIGYGDERPIASNDTPGGRQRNRRIEASEL